MLLFNGMYFRGSWRSPFAPLEQREAFYPAEGRKVSVPMMRSRGAFRVGHIPELDSVAVELPYEGDRYSLLVLLPNAAGGLRSLVADLAGYSLRNLYESMASREVEVTLPCFAIETITRPIPVFSKMGVSDVFSAEKADLRGVSSAGGLFVQDLVQLVTVRVDNSSSVLNQITSSSIESRTGSFEKIVADKPFLYFVRDISDNLVVVAGKVVNPEDRPTTYKTTVVLPTIS
ncbi:hypothetical protein R5R35_007543 [Gryllus longicercus]|uniref:Serpin domain-containing protein n=1 Tax=Gryllus longicercus TaxID=2509291 RepID=A0AAN9VTR2_9ORTH